MGRTYPPPPCLKPSQHLRPMKMLWPSLRGRLERNGAAWTGTLRPGPLCREYTVEVRYHPDTEPPVEVRVLSPALQVPPGWKTVPHTYPTRGTLCLYRPKLNEWKRTDQIADTIIPWTILWLRFYEACLVTGEWQGGGEHPGDKGE